MRGRWLLMLLLGLMVAAGRVMSEDSSSPPKTIDAAEMFTARMLVVKGEGLAPPDATSKGQRRLMAQRAAKVVAQRELVETLGRVRVTGDTTVDSGIRRSDRVRSAVDGILTGAHVLYESYDENEGTAAVYLQLKLDGPYGVISNLLPTILEQHDSDVQTLPAYKPAATAPPPGPEPADGLVIDATGSGFRPAMINRILAASGSALFEPSKVAAEVLAKNGCGDYTDNIGKAKAILERRGAKHPLVVKVAAVQRSTDAQVSDADAAAIFSANQKTNFLEGAKVVFVL